MQYLTQYFIKSSKIWAMITFAMLAWGGEGDISSILMGLYAMLLMADSFTGV